MNAPRSRWLILSLLLLAGAQAGTANGADTARQSQTLQSAHGFLGKGLYDLAAKEYRAYLEDDGDDPTAGYGLAVCLERLGDPGGAIDALEAIEPGQPFAFAAEASYLNAACLYELGRYREAAQALDAFLRNNPEHTAAPRAGSMLVESLGQTGETRESIAAADAFLELWPGDASAQRVRFLLGVALEQNDEPERAAEALRRVAEGSGPDAADAAYRLGVILERAGDTDAARQSYSAAAEDPRTAPLATLALARLAREAGDAAGAAGATERWLREHPDHPNAAAARIVLGRALLDLGRPADAADPLSEAAGDGPTGFRASYWLARAQLDSGDTREAIRGFREVVSRAEEPGAAALLPYARYDLGRALQEAGDAAGAAREFARVRDEFPQHTLASHALYAEASIALEEGDADRAGRLAQRLLSNNPGGELASDAAVLLADAQYLNGDPAGAVRTLERLGRESAGGLTPYAEYRLGLALQETGQAGDARKALTEAAENAAGDARLRPALLALADLAYDAGDWDEALAQTRAYLDLADDPEQPGTRRALLTRGLALARTGEHREALAPLEVLIDQPGAPERARALLGAARSLVALGCPGEAAEHLHTLLAMRGSGELAPFAQRALGEIAFEQGDAQAAAEWYAKTAGSDNADPADHLNLARALLASGDAAGAARALTAPSLLTAPEDVREQATAVRAVALSRTGDSRRALRLFDELEGAGTLDEGTREKLGFERAITLRDAGRADDAAEVFAGLLGSASVGDRAALELAALRMDQGSPDDAVSLLDGLVDRRDELPPDLAERAVYRRGVCAHLTGDARRAADLLVPFHDMYPQSSVVVSADLIAARALQTLGRDRESIAALRRVVAADPPGDQLEPALLMLADGLAEAQRFDESLAAAREHQRRFPDSELWFRSRFAQAWALENEGEYAAAIEAYRDVSDRHRGDTAARAQFQIGECLFAQGRHEDAAAELLKVDILHASPRWSAAAVYEAGRCFEAANKTGEARAQYRDTIARFPDSDWAAPARERLDAMRRASTPGRGGF